MHPLVEKSWPSDQNYFCLAIQVVDPSVRQFHAMMLYRCNQKLMVGDLQSHMRTRRSLAECNKNIFWVSLDLSLEDQKILASKLDAWLSLNNNRIPYSVAHPGGVIFKEDLWVGHDPAQGLTCATFVVELFDELAIPFIKKETWKARPGDDEWAKYILEQMGDMPDEHKNAQRNLIGKTARIRPSDTFAAGMLVNQESSESLSFEVVAPKAEELEEELLLPH